MLSPVDVSPPVCNLDALRLMMRRYGRVIFTMRRWAAEVPERLLSPDEIAVLSTEALAKYTTGVERAKASLEVGWPYARSEHPEDVFAELLVGYDFPRELRAKVRDAACAWSTRPRAPAREDSVKAFWREHAFFLSFRALMQEAKKKGVRKTEHRRVGAIDIVNAGGFSEKAMDRAFAEVEATVALLVAKGLGWLAYGRILFLDRLPNKGAAATYNPPQDEIHVLWKARDRDRVGSQTLAHEFGHRLRFRKLYNANDEIDALFVHMIHLRDAERSNTLMADWEEGLRPGQTLWIEDRVYRVCTPEQCGRNHQKVPPDNVCVRAANGTTRHLSLNDYLHYGDDVTWPFVSDYAATHAEENFAEMFEAWCHGLRLGPEEDRFLALVSPFSAMARAS